MNFLSEEYSSAIYTGRSKQGWIDFGLSQLEALGQFLGLNPKKGFYEALGSQLVFRRVRKGEVLIDLGDVACKMYFVMSGRLKGLALGSENSLRSNLLFDEGNIPTSLQTFLTGAPSEVRIEALSACKLFEFSAEGLTAMAKSKFKEDIFNMQQALMLRFFNYSNSYQHMLILSAEEKIRHIIKHFPNVLKNFKQKDVASFCDLKAETFSRVLARVKN